MAKVEIYTTPFCGFCLQDAQLYTSGKRTEKKIAKVAAFL
jgi:glutaredoxin